jgi:hypothetical protein
MFRSPVDAYGPHLGSLVCPPIRQRGFRISRAAEPGARTRANVGFLGGAIAQVLRQPGGFPSGQCGLANGAQDDESENHAEISHFNLPSPEVRGTKLAQQL